MKEGAKSRKGKKKGGKRSSKTKEENAPRVELLSRGLANNHSSCIRKFGVLCVRWVTDHTPGIVLKGYIEYALAPKDLEQWSLAREDKKKSLQNEDEDDHGKMEKEEEEEEEYDDSSLAQDGEAEPAIKRRKKEDEEDNLSKSDPKEASENLMDSDPDDEGEGSGVEWELPSDIADSDETATEAAVRVFQQSTDLSSGTHTLFLYEG